MQKYIFIVESKLVLVAFVCFIFFLLYFLLCSVCLFYFLLFFPRESRALRREFAMPSITPVVQTIYSIGLTPPSPFKKTALPNESRSVEIPCLASPGL